MMKCSHNLKRIFQLLSLAGVWSRHLEGGIDSTVTVMLVAMSCFLVERETGIKIQLNCISMYNTSFYHYVYVKLLHAPRSTKTCCCIRTSTIVGSRPV